MDKLRYEDILNRIGYVRSNANLSAKKLSELMDMSPQYVAQIESGRIVLTIEKLLQILEICNFSLERFFSKNINDFEEDTELSSIIQSMSLNRKKSLIEFIKSK